MIGSRKKLIKAVIALILTAVLSIIASGCDDFSFYTRLDGAGALRLNTPGGLPSGTLTIIPEEAVLPISTSYIFTATGGAAPYIFSLVSGSGSIEEDSGLYRAPAAPDEAVVAVIDSTGFVSEAAIKIVSVGEFTAAPASITLYTYNTTTFTVLGGVAPFSWSLVSGSGSVNNETGVYTASSSPGSDVIRVTDSLGNYSDAAITVLSPFSLKIPSLLITVNNKYTFTAEGGKLPYVFSIVSGGGTIDADTGEYTAPGTSGTAVVRAADALGNLDSAEITITPEAALQIVPASITLNTGGSTTFFATGGTGPYEFIILSGGGVIESPSGVYTAGGASGSDIVRLTDDLGETRDAVVTVVSSGPLSILPSAVLVEQNEIYDFYADGGSPPYSFSVSSGSGTINSASGLYYAPAAIGSCKVRVTDSIGDWNESDVDIAPAAPTNLTADGTVENPDTITISWSDNANGEDGFIIERKQGAGAFSVIDTIGAESISYPDSGLAPNNLYGYRVRAFWGALLSGYSNESYDLPNS